MLPNNLQGNGIRYHGCRWSCRWVRLLLVGVKQQESEKGIRKSSSALEPLDLEGSCQCVPSHKYENGGHATCWASFICFWWSCGRGTWWGVGSIVGQIPTRTASWNFRHFLSIFPLYLRIDPMLATFIANFSAILRQVSSILRPCTMCQCLPSWAFVRFYYR